MEVWMLVTPGRFIRKDEPIGLDFGGYVRDCPAHHKYCVGLTVEDSVEIPGRPNHHKVLVAIQGTF